MEKREKFIFNVLFVLFLPLIVFAQEKNFPDIDKYFSKKEKATFDCALEYQNVFYNKIFPEVIVDFSEIQISVIGEFSNILLQKKSSGYYSSFYRELVIFKAPQYKNTFMRTTFHELSHALLHLYSGDQFDHIPPWLNEGLADYLAGMTYSSKKIIHKKNNSRITRLKTLIELRDLDLADFANWNHQKFTKESFSQEGYGYAVGYCMVCFLINKEEKDIYSLFRLLIEKDNDKSTTEIFDNHYEGGFLQFQRDFFDFYSK